MAGGVVPGGRAAGMGVRSWEGGENGAVGAWPATGQVIDRSTTMASIHRPGSIEGCPDRIGRRRSGNRLGSRRVAMGDTASCGWRRNGLMMRRAAFRRGHRSLLWLRGSCGRRTVLFLMEETTQPRLGACRRSGHGRGTRRLRQRLGGRCRLLRTAGYRRFVRWPQ